MSRHSGLLMSVKLCMLGNFVRPNHGTPAGSLETISAPRKIIRGSLSKTLDSYHHTLPSAVDTHGQWAFCGSRGSGGYGLPE